MVDLRLFNGLGNSYGVLSDVPFWLSMMQFRTQLEREFAEKAEKWCKNVSDKLYILRQHSVDGIIHIESALRMEVAMMEERTSFARESLCSYEEAAKLLLNERKADDEKVILRKYETSFQEMLNPYKRFCNRVEKGQKVYNRSMVRLEKLVLEENASWFCKRKLKKARKVAKRNSDGYIKLLKEETNQAVNIASLSLEYEGVATEIAAKKVKAFVDCWSTCMSQNEENSSGDTRNVTDPGQYLLSKVDSEKLVKLLSDFNKESLHIPTYQEFKGTVDVEELLGYQPVVETIISEDDVRDGYKENKPMTPADSYDRLFNPFCLNEDEVRDGYKENKPMTPADSYDRLFNPFCLNGNEKDEEQEELNGNKPLTPADSYDKLYNPFCFNDDENNEEKKGEVNPCTPVDCCGERRLDRCVKAVAINNHKKMECLEMDVKQGDLVEQLTPPNSMGMVYGMRRSRITRKKMGGFIPSICISPSLL